MSMEKDYLKLIDGALKKKEKKMKKGLTHHKKTVLDWFERALQQKATVYINMWYAPHGDAWTALSKDGIIKTEKLGNIEVGTSYKGHLFNVEYGPGDCEERLVCQGKI